MNESSILLAAALLIISPLAFAGLALLNAGLGRSRSAAQALLGNLAMLAVAVVCFALVGATLAGVPGSTGQGIAIHAAGKSWQICGAASFALSWLGSAGPSAQLGCLFEFLAVAFIGILPWGSGADRLRLEAGCAIAAVFGVFLFPVMANWAWAGGWLQALGTNFGLGAGFLDAGGAASVHLLGGVAALAVVWVTGARHGKFPKEGFATALPGHNAVYILFGSLIALIGWTAFNLAGALLWAKLPLTALPVVAINTMLTASAALIAAYVVTRTRFGKPDASLCANGWLTGLVASSASAAILTPGEAIFAGAVAGILTPLLVEVIELALSIDDPSGAVTVHAVGALWGLLVSGIFAPKPGQFVAQLVGISTLLGFFLPVIYGLFLLLNLVVPFRVDPDGERLGMDLHELGGGAYPEFVIHRDDSYR